MPHEILPTGRSGDLHGNLWTTSEVARGVVIAIHGLGDHSGRFAVIADDLCRAGWNLFAFDIQGHGRSPGPRGKIDNYNGLLADIAAARVSLERRLGPMPHCILGQSMGGNLALNFVLRSAEFSAVESTIAAMLLISPMILPPDPPQRPHVFAAWLTGRVFRWLRFGTSVPKDKLAQDDQLASCIVEDSLTHSQISVHLVTQLLAQGRWALDHAREVDLPTLILYGDDDELIDRSACEHLAVRIGPKALSRKFSGMRHAMLHDNGREAVIGALIEWLKGIG